MLVANTVQSLLSYQLLGAQHDGRWLFWQPVLLFNIILYGCLEK